MPSLKEIIKDKAKYPDNMLVTLPDGSQVNLGAVRAQEDADLAAFTKQQDDLKKAQDLLIVDRGKLEADMAALRTAQAKVAELFAQTQGQGGDAAAQAAAAAATAQDPFVLHAKDPVFGPVITKLREIEKANQDLLNVHLKKITDTLTQIGKGYVDDRLSDMLERIPNRKAEIGDEAIIKHAISNGYFTRTGVPDVRKAYKDLTAASDKQAEIDAAVAAALKKRDEELAAAAGAGAGPGRPSMTFISPGQQQSQTKYASLDAALAAAKNDPEIWQNFGKA